MMSPIKITSKMPAITLPAKTANKTPKTKMQRFVMLET